MSNIVHADDGRGYHSISGMMTNGGGGSSDDASSSIDLRWFIPIAMFIVVLNACRVRYHRRPRRQMRDDGREETSAGRGENNDDEEAGVGVRTTTEGMGFEDNELGRHRRGIRGSWWQGRQVHTANHHDGVGSLQWMESNRDIVPHAILKEIRCVEVMKHLVEKDVLPIQWTNERYNESSGTKDSDENGDTEEIRNICTSRPSLCSDDGQRQQSNTSLDSEQESVDSGIFVAVNVEHVADSTDADNTGISASFVGALEDGRENTTNTTPHHSMACATISKSGERRKRRKGNIYETSTSSTVRPFMDGLHGALTPLRPHHQQSQPPAPDPAPPASRVSVSVTCSANDHAHRKPKEEEEELQQQQEEGHPPPLSCSICLEGYEAGQKICWSTNDRCAHAFHKDCIVEWLLKRDDCPICRTDYFEREGNQRNTRVS